jgi:2-deoxy-D-gluconate 3-dehydrogenase
MLAEAGADVVGVGRQAMPETGAAVAASGRRFHTIQADIGSLDSAEPLIASAVSQFGRFDILINAAGITHRQAALDCPVDKFDLVMDTNLRAAFVLSQAAARHFTTRPGGGRIILIASMLTFQGGLNVMPYAASKSGIAGLVRALANEWASLGINVNAIAPGYIATEMTKPIQDDPQRNPQILARIPANRWGKPEDIAGLAVFLASDAAAYAHGSIYPVDGGWLSR